MNEDDIDVEVVDVEPESNEPSEAEVKARRLGWVPQEEFKGDPEQWRDADDFLKRGEEIHGFMKADLERLHTTLTQRDKELAEIRSTMEEFRKFHNETEARAYKRAIDELKAMKADAVREGDGDKVVELDEQIDELREAQRSKPAGNTAQKTEQINREYLDWLPQNRWYVEDVELQQIAHEEGELIKARYPDLLGKAFLDKVTERVKKVAPDKFENPMRSQSSVASSSDSRPSTSKKKRGYNDLPAEAKEACDRFVKQKLLTVEQYLAEYSWE